MGDELDSLISKYRDAVLDGCASSEARGEIREHVARAEALSANIATLQERRRCVEASVRAFITYTAPAILAAQGMTAETMVALLTGHGEALQRMLRGEG